MNREIAAFVVDGTSLTGVHDEAFPPVEGQYSDSIATDVLGPGLDATFSVEKAPREVELLALLFLNIGVGSSIPKRDFQLELSSSEEKAVVPILHIYELRR